MQSSSFLKGNATSCSNDHELFKVIGLLIILFSFGALVNAQSVPPQKQWDKVFGGTQSERLASMVPTPNGGYLLGGSALSGIGGDKSEPNRGYFEDYWIVKIDMDGKKQIQEL